MNAPRPFLVLTAVFLSVAAASAQTNPTITVTPATAAVIGPANTTANYLAVGNYNVGSFPSCQRVTLQVYHQSSTPGNSTLSAEVDATISVLASDDGPPILPNSGSFSGSIAGFTYSGDAGTKFYMKARLYNTSIGIIQETNWVLISKPN